MKDKEYKDLILENHEIDEQKRKLKSQLKELNIKHDINELKIKNKKSEITVGDSLTFEREFMNISKAILDEKTYSKLIYLTFEKTESKNK